MTNKLTLASALFALALLTGAASAAPATQFEGSRADVRGFCTGAGYDLVEGGNFSICLTPLTDVVCRDDNVCSSSNLDLALAAGFKSKVAAV